MLKHQTDSVDVNHEKNFVIQVLVWLLLKPIFNLAITNEGLKKNAITEIVVKSVIALL